MRRVSPVCHLPICHSLCLIALLVIPVLVSAHGHGVQQEKWEFLCTADGLSVTLERSSEKDPSTDKSNEGAVNNTIWTLRVDRDLWHGELIEMHHGESTNRVTNLHQGFKLEFPIALCSQNETQWSQVRILSNKRRPMQILARTASDKTGIGGQGMLVMLCKPKCSNNTATQHNHTVDDRCLTSSNSLISLAENDRLRTTLLFHSKGVFSSMLFHPHDQCTWSNHTVITGQGYESAGQLPQQKYGSSAGLFFFDENKVIQMLELSLNSSLLPSFSQRTFRERIEGLLDERRVKYACNQGTTKSFVAKNMRNLHLQVYSSMIEGSNGGRHGFEVSHLHNFNLEPGQSAKILISYKPDFKAGISDGRLQLVTSAGIVYVAVKANIPADMLEFCQNAALIERAKSFTLQVCSMALFLVLLVFGKMLKQEGDNASGSSGSRIELNRESQRSSFYLTITLGCTSDESKHSSNFWSLGFIYAVMNWIMGSRMSCISQKSMVQVPASSSVKKGQAAPKENIPANLTTTSIGKKKAPPHPRACYQSSAANPSHGNSPLRSTAYLYTRDKPIPQLKIPRPSEPVEPESPTRVLPNKEREKAKQKKKKGNRLQVTGMENGNDTGYSSPLSMPSSPVTRGTSVSPVSCKTHTSVHDHDKTQSSNVSQCHSSMDSRLQCSDGNFSEPNRMRKTSKSLPDENTRNPGTSTDTKRVNSCEGKSKNAAIQTKCTTLTVSHTFPAAGRRFSVEGFPSSQEDGQKWPLVASSSSSDLVSTSSVASHARAPGSPLSATSQSFPNSPLSHSSSTSTGNPFSSSSSSFPGSPFSSSPAFSGSPLVHKVIPSLDSPLSSSSPNLNEPVPDHCQDLWPSTTSPFFGSSSSGSRRYSRQEEPYRPRYMNDWDGPSSNMSNCYPRYDLNSGQRKVHDRHYGLEGVALYDMWENHFTEVSQRWRSSWVGKETPFRRTMPPSSLPPLLKTPAFSIFSTNDPFSV